ncbi:predicted protein [Lichtheimia corymbifera JMRC:FSU:9682]|uniref:Uncharacterized protein n=1 Tax=Lichtheimia corymbifera JMRC:FSU:9682 TaxID=1263082 RepID=A0A068RJK2_9FUNG|nr:predicted protein [Lichtheimia corymbifera JMRC:FSU:9682]
MPSNDHVDTAEDDDGLDEIDEVDYILAKGALQPWILWNTLVNAYSICFAIMDGGSNQEYNGTFIPVALDVIHP